MATLKITASSVAKLINKPPRKNTRYSDDGQPNFGVRVTPKGKATFFCQYRLNGKKYGPFMLDGGEVFEHRNTQALQAQIKNMRKMAAEYHREAKLGIDPRGEEVPVSDITLGAHLMEYLQTHAIAKKRPASVEKDARLIDLHIPAWMKAKPIEDVSKADIMKHHALMQNMKPTANSVLRLLSKAFNLAIDWGIIDKNPVHGVVHYEEHPRERYLSPEEITRLDDTLTLILGTDGDGNMAKQHPAAAAIKLIMVTGSRKSEVLSAEWYMFDLERGVWSKPFTHTKQKKTVHIPLSDEAVTLLKSMKEKAPAGARWLFPNASHTGHIRDIKTFWMKLRDELELDSVRIHDLRHTYASILVQNNIDPTAIQTLLGHSKIDTTLRYMHRKVEHLRAATTVFQAEKSRAIKDDDYDLEKIRNSKPDVD